MSEAYNATALSTSTASISLFFNLLQDLPWIEMASSLSAVPKPLGLVKVAGDGDCLFHVLALHHNEDGGALRIDVANFMAERAADQPGFEDDWLREVAKLRAYRWGGATVMAAYSLMKNVRVMLHTWRGVGLPPTVMEMSHGAIFGNESVRMIHVFYNGRDHYDALLEIIDLKDLQPAWLQCPPPYITDFNLFYSVLLMAYQ